MGSRSFTIILLALALSATILLPGCSATKEAAVTATLTFKDGSHFNGTVVRREPKAITMLDGSGSTRTFLYSELVDIKYGTPASDAKTAATAAQSEQVTVPTASTGSPEPGYTGAEDVKIPVGTEFPVTTNGFLDSSYTPVGAYSVGTLDADFRAGGKVVLPRGTRVTIITADKHTTDGRIVMRFDLGAAEVGGRSYVISSEKSSLEPGLTVAFTGEKENSPGAKAHGTGVHLDDHDLMIFKAVTPTVLKLPK